MLPFTFTAQCNSHKTHSASGHTQCGQANGDVEFTMLEFRTSGPGLRLQLSY